MEDVLSLIYANRDAHGLPCNDVASARLVTQRYALELRNYTLLSAFYTRKEWQKIGNYTGYFARGVDHQGETYYMMGVQEGTGMKSRGTIFYVETKQNDDQQTYHHQDDEWIGMEEFYFISKFREGDTNKNFASVDIAEPDVLGKLKLTYERCEKFGIPRSVGLQYVLDGIEGVCVAKPSGKMLLK